jgi:hypothetical protein
MRISAKTIFRAMLTLVLAAVLCGEPAVCQEHLQGSRGQLQTLSRKQVADVILAIEDEVYDYSEEKAFGVATNDSPVKAATLALYVNPHLTSDGRGEVIYKYLPFGEVIRDLYIRPDGLVVLGGNPRIGFPVTQPSHLTQFMDGRELRQDKSRWLHGEFTILLHPPKKLVLQAAERQVKRVGFSDFTGIYVDRDSK